MLTIQDQKRNLEEKNIIEAIKKNNREEFSTFLKLNPNHFG